MRIAICEDNAADAAEIRAYLDQHFEREGYMGDIDTFAGGEDLLAAFSPGAFALIFMDIYLSGMSGVETARTIRAADPDCVLVFITVDPGHMPEGFALRAASYVVKPITQEQMDTALLQCRKLFLQNARFIEVKSGGQSLRLPLPKVLYVEMLDKVATIHTTEGAVRTYTPMEEIERQLGGRPFLRCHRAYIVNMNYVEDIDKNDIVMRGGARAPLRKNGRKEIRAALSDFFTERLYENGPCE